MFKVVFTIVVVSILLISVEAATVNDINFHVFNQSGQAIFNYKNETGNQALLETCPEGEKVILVVPGIQGNISVYFAKQLIENCLKYFGGSVIFVEYIPYTTNYLYLIRNYVFDEISTAIAEQLEFLHANGRNINDSILIGASFGSRLVVNVGLILKRSDIVVRRIDAMDPAGPLIDNNIFLYRNISNAARFSQCIHTSWDYGTRIWNQCTRNWILGNCGYSQPGTNNTNGFSNHQFAMQYYVSSFNNPFIAEENQYRCSFPGKLGVYSEKPILMGAMTDEDINFQGIFFHRANKTYPFNYIGNETIVETTEINTTIETDLDTTEIPEIDEEDNTVETNFD